MNDHQSSKSLTTMNLEESSRIIKLLKDALMEKRSKKEITQTFEDAGIIDENGDLKSPYKKIYIPAE